MGLFASTKINIQNKRVEVPNNGNLIITTERNQIGLNFNSGIWDTLNKEICICIDGEYSTLELIDNLITIPSSIITAYQNKILYIGIRGTNTSGDFVYPTVYAKLGVIR